MSIFIILSSLVNNLFNKGLIKEAEDINDLLYKFLEECEDEDLQDSDDSILANLTGLREDGLLENMNQGMSLEPFFSNYNTTD